MRPIRAPLGHSSHPVVFVVGMSLLAAWAATQSAACLSKGDNNVNTRVCTPGDHRCSGSLAQTCADDGSKWSTDKDCSPRSCSSLTLTCEATGQGGSAGAGGTSGQGGAAGTGGSAGTGGAAGSADAGPDCGTLTACGSACCEPDQYCDGNDTCAYASSCSELLDKAVVAAGTNGVHRIQHPHGLMNVYCDMTQAAGGKTGGWTLCLNSRFAPECAALFKNDGARVYPPNDDALGCYEFCSDTAGEYLYALGDQVDATSEYVLKDAILHLKSCEAATFTGRGIQNCVVDTIACPEDFTELCAGATTVAFWTGNANGLNHAEFYRGMIQRGGLYNGKDATWRIGAGCDNTGCCAQEAGCNFPVLTQPDSLGSDEWASPNASQDWGFRIKASAARIATNPGSGFTAPPINQDRVLVFYR